MVVCGLRFLWAVLGAVKAVSVAGDADTPPDATEASVRLPVWIGRVAAAGLVVLELLGFRFAEPVNQGPCATMRFKDP